MNLLSFKACAGICTILFLMSSGGLSAAGKPKTKPMLDPRIGAMRLLPGYVHKKLQGIDSIVGKIEKPGGLSIMYDIGNIPKPGQPRFGGSFTDRPKNAPVANRHWYKEQIVNGVPMHFAYLKNGYLIVSAQQGRRGINFGVRVNNMEELADVLLMIMTYPAPAKK